MLNFSDELGFVASALVRIGLLLVFELVDCCLHFADIAIVLVHLLEEISLFFLDLFELAIDFANSSKQFALLALGLFVLVDLLVHCFLESQLASSHLATLLDLRLLFLQFLFFFSQVVYIRVKLNHFTVEVIL